jgi:hypothetical protein
MEFMNHITNSLASRLAIFLLLHNFFCNCVKSFLTAKPAGPKLNQFQAANDGILLWKAITLMAGVLALPRQTLAAYFAGIGVDRSCANAQKGWRALKIRAMLYLEAQESPGARTTETEKRRKKKYECCRDQKGNRGNVETL